MKRPITVHLVISAIGDVLITVGMSAILRQYRENTAFLKTKSLLNKLIINTVENGLVTSVWAIGNIIVYFTRTQDLINVAFQYIIGGIYAIVFITTLNKRKDSRNAWGTDLSLSDAQAFSNHSLGGRSGRLTTLSIGPHNLNASARSDNFQLTALRTMESEDAKAPRDVLISVSRQVHTESAGAKAYVGSTVAL